MSARCEDEARRREENQAEQEGSHGFLDASGATTERGRMDLGGAAARITAQWWARAWKIGCRSGELAPKRLPRERRPPAKPAGGCATPFTAPRPTDDPTRAVATAGLLRCPSRPALNGMADYSGGCCVLMGQTRDCYGGSMCMGPTVLGTILGSSIVQVRPGYGLTWGSHFAYLSPRTLMHSASDTQDRQRPAVQIPRQPSASSRVPGICAAFPLIHLCPYLSMQLQMAAQRPRSQKPSPHSPSVLHWESGTSFDHGRAHWYPGLSGSQSSAIVWSSGVNWPRGVGTSAVGL